MARKIVDRMIIIPPFIRETIAYLGVSVVKLELGFNINNHLPKDAITRFKSQPVLIIHGRNDPLIPFSESEKLFKNAIEPKEFYTIDAFGHYATFYDPEYVSTIKSFLLRNSNGGEQPL